MSPTWGLGPKRLGHPPLFLLVHLAGELDQKWSSWESNQCPGDVHVASSSIIYITILAPNWTFIGFLYFWVGFGHLFMFLFERQRNAEPYTEEGRPRTILEVPWWELNLVFLEWQGPGCLSSPIFASQDVQHQEAGTSNQKWNSNFRTLTWAAGVFICMLTMYPLLSIP